MGRVIRVVGFVEGVNGLSQLNKPLWDNIIHQRYEHYQGITPNVDEGLMRMLNWLEHVKKNCFSIKSYLKTRWMDNA